MGSTALQERQDSTTHDISYPVPWRNDAVGRIVPEWSRGHGSHFRVRIISRLPTQLRSSDQKNLPILVKRDSNSERFNNLVTAWKASAGAYSSAMKIAIHPAYQQMIGMGAAALPFIFEKLKAEQQEPDHWFWALASITEANPVPKESRGRLPEMAKAWLKWGSEKGYVSLD